MRWSLPINANIAGTLRAWRSEIIGGNLLDIPAFSFGNFDPQINFNGMTVTNFNVVRARYLRIFKMFWFTFEATATLAAPFASTINIIIPNTGKSTQIAVGYGQNAGTGELSVHQLLANANTVQIYRQAFGNYTAGVWYSRVNGFYEID